MCLQSLACKLRVSGWAALVVFARAYRRVAASHAKVSAHTRGVIWLVVSALLYAAMNVLVKRLSGYPPAVQALCTQTSALLLLIPMISRHPRRYLVIDGFWIQCGRSVSSVLGVTLSYYAVQHLPLADANALAFTRAFWIGPLAVIFFRKRITVREWLLPVIAFAGVLLIVRPTADTPIGWAHFAALASAFCLALTVTGIKALTRRNSLASIMVWSSLLGVPLILPFAIYSWKWPSLAELPLLGLLGLVSILMTSSYGQAMRLGEPTRLAVVDFIRLPIAIVAGLALFGEVPGVSALLGAVLILCAAGAATVGTSSRSPDSPEETRSRVAK